LVTLAYADSAGHAIQQNALAKAVLSFVADSACLGAPGCVLKCAFYNSSNAIWVVDSTITTTVVGQNVQCSTSKAATVAAFSTKQKESSNAFFDNQSNLIAVIVGGAGAILLTAFLIDARRRYKKREKEAATQVTYEPSPSGVELATVSDLKMFKDKGQVNDSVLSLASIDESKEVRPAGAKPNFERRKSNHRTDQRLDTLVSIYDTLPDSAPSQLSPEPPGLYGSSSSAALAASTTAPTSAVVPSTSAELESTVPEGHTEKDEVLKRALTRDSVIAGSLLDLHSMLSPRTRLKGETGTLPDTANAFRSASPGPNTTGGAGAGAASSSSGLGGAGMVQSASVESFESAPDDVQLPIAQSAAVAAGSMPSSSSTFVLPSFNINDGFTGRAVSSAQLQDPMFEETHVDDDAHTDQKHNEPNTTTATVDTGMAHGLVGSPSDVDFAAAAAVVPQGYYDPNDPQMMQQYDPNAQQAYYMDENGQAVMYDPTAVQQFVVDPNSVAADAAAQQQQQQQFYDPNQQYFDENGNMIDPNAYVMATDPSMIQLVGSQNPEAEAGAGAGAGAGYGLGAGAPMAPGSGNHEQFEDHTGGVNEEFH